MVNDFVEKMTRMSILYLFIKKSLSGAGMMAHLANPLPSSTSIPHGHQFIS